MSQQQKAAYFRTLKSSGVTFDKHYREYTESELKAAYDRLVEERPDLAIAEQPAPPADQPRPSLADMADQAQAQRDAQRAAETQQRAVVPLREADPNELPGMRLNSQTEDEPIRTDEQGRVWYQEEVLKPGYAKPRGRRVLQYTDRGSVTQQIQNGDYIESFEVDGTGPGRTAEIKITLPSYQTGIYKDPRFPFKIHTYNGVQGFDFAEVAAYYNGVDLVPPSIKRMYVENVLCYDMRSTIQAIQAEFRQMQLTGRIR